MSKIERKNKKEAKIEDTEIENVQKDAKDSNDASDETTTRKNVSPKKDDKKLGFVQ